LVITFLLEGYIHRTLMVLGNILFNWPKLAASI